MQDKRNEQRLPASPSPHSEVDAERIQGALSEDSAPLTREVALELARNFYLSVCGDLGAQRFEQDLLPKMDRVLGGNPRSLLKAAWSIVEEFGDLQPRKLPGAMDQIELKYERLASVRVATTAEVCQFVSAALRIAAREHEGSDRPITLAAVVIHGSYATGKQHAASDLDLAAVYDKGGVEHGAEIVERKIRKEFHDAGYTEPILPILTFLDASCHSGNGPDIVAGLEGDCILRGRYIVITRDESLEKLLLESGLPPEKLFRGPPR